MWLDRKSDWRPASTPENVPITPGPGRSRVWDGLVRVLGKRLFLLACAVGVSFAFIYVEMTTKLFFSLNAPRQVGDPCLHTDPANEGDRPRRGLVELRALFGRYTARSGPRDARRRLALRYLDVHKTEPVLMTALPWPLTRVQRNLDRFSRAFGTGGSHSYNIGLVGDAAQSTFVNLVMAGVGGSTIARRHGAVCMTRTSAGTSRTRHCSGPVKTGSSDETTALNCRSLRARMPRDWSRQPFSA